MNSRARTWRARAAGGQARRARSARTRSRKCSRRRTTTAARRSALAIAAAGGSARAPLQRGDRARQLRFLPRQRLRATVRVERVGGARRDGVNFGDALERGQVLGRRVQHRGQFRQRVVELAQVEQRATERRARGHVFGMERQAGRGRCGPLPAADRRAAALRRAAQTPATPDPAGSGVAAPESAGCPPRGQSSRRAMAPRR